jgi:FixJ family two-component response regulator
MAAVAIVDDDVSIRRAVANLLRAHGIDAQSYGSARDFLAALSFGMPDCLITDLNMPHMSGLELQRELMRLGAPIPTIVVTGCNDTSTRDQCRALGAAAYLVKPVDEDALITAISSAVTRNEYSDNDRQSEDRRTVERLRNAVSQMQQAIVQTLAVIDETRRLIGWAEEIVRPVIRVMPTSSVSDPRLWSGRAAAMRMLADEMQDIKARGHDAQGRRQR